MVNIKDDKYFVDKILKSINIIEATYKGKTVKDLEQDIFVNNTIMFQLIMIGENSTRLSEEYKNSKNNISWQKIKGLRNLVVHDYDGVKYDIIDDTIVNDIEEFKKELLK